MRAAISKLKSDAREQLLGKYMQFFPLLLVYFLLELVAGYLPLLMFTSTDTFSGIARFGTSFILNALFGMAGAGLIKASLDFIRGQSFSVSTLFYAFRNNADAFVIIQLILTAVKTAFSFLSLIVDHFAILYEWTDMVYYLAYSASLLGVLFLTMTATLKLIWASYFVIDGEARTAREALRMSLRFSKGRTFEIFYMKLSFIGMFILSYCSMLIGFIYVRPYSEVTYALYYLDKK